MSKTKEQFQEFHKENPKVYQLFCYFTRLVINSGHKKYSAEGIFNQIRWYTTVETNDEQYKINNDYKPYYSRKFMNDFDVDIFRVRKSVADIEITTEI